MTRQVSAASLTLQSSNNLPNTPHPPMSLSQNVSKSLKSSPHKSSQSSLNSSSISNNNPPSVTHSANASPQTFRTANRQMTQFNKHHKAKTLQSARQISHTSAYNLGDRLSTPSRHGKTGSAQTNLGGIVDQLKSQGDLSTSSYLQHAHSSLGMKTSYNASETGSLFTRNIKERLKEFGHPLRGPITVQIGIHYIFFIFLLAFANILGWAPYIRVFMGGAYISVALIILQFSRIALTKVPNSVIPFYLTLIPFLGVIIISREAHYITMVLWYVSVLVIYLQSGNIELQKHLIIFSGFFILAYCGAVYFMKQFYTDDCLQSGCGMKLTEPIEVLKELVVVVGCCGVVLCFTMLEKFIKMNAITLLERENYMNQLFLANVDLKRQLRNAKQNNEIDLEAPLARAIQVLKEVKESPDIDNETCAQLDAVIRVLGTDQLYNPNLYQKSGDADVHDWLNDMLLTKQQVVDVVKKQSDSQPQKPTVTFATTISLSPLDEEIFEQMTEFENPNFNIFDLDKISNGKPLLYVGWYIFRKHNFFSQFSISEAKFLHWCSKIESGYKQTNPYHNCIHAADVTQAMYYYITRDRLWKHLPPEERLASVIAAIIHDYMHPGVNNAFLISTQSPLSIRYNDTSVLEHFHSASAFELMLTDEYNILTGFSFDTRKHIREMIVSMVLATDIAVHFEWIGKFKNKQTAGQGFNFENKADRKLVLNIAIKCADVNNPAKPLNQCKKWTENIMEEFFRQGDEERKRGLPISMFMNRDTTDIPKCQIGFIDFIVYPLFETWYNFMQEDVQTNMDNIQTNKAYWKARSEKNISIYNGSTSILVNPSIASSISHQSSVVSNSALDSRPSTPENLPGSSVPSIQHPQLSHQGAKPGSHHERKSISEKHGSATPIPRHRLVDVVASSSENMLSNKNSSGEQRKEGEADGISGSKKRLKQSDKEKTKRDL